MGTEIASKLTLFLLKHAQWGIHHVVIKFQVFLKCGTEKEWKMEQKGALDSLNQRKAFVSSNYYSSSKFLWARFLRDGWMDLNEIWHLCGSVYEVYRKLCFSKNSLPVRKYRWFSLKNIDFCLRVFSETAKDNWMKLWGIVDQWLNFV